MKLSTISYEGPGLTTLTPAELWEAIEAHGISPLDALNAAAGLMDVEPRDVMLSATIMLALLGSTEGAEEFESIAGEDTKAALGLLVAAIDAVTE